MDDQAERPSFEFQRRTLILSGALLLLVGVVRVLFDIYWNLL